MTKYILGFSLFLAGIIAWAAEPAPTLTLSPSSTVLGLNGAGAIEPVYDPDGPSGSQLEQYLSATSLAGVAFSSSDTRIAIVDSKGTLTARGLGVATITATYKGISAQTKVKVAGKVESYSFQTPDGRTRSYLLYVPSTYAPATPVSLIMTFHGGGGNSQSQMETSQMNVLADQEGFIVAYPQGTGLLPKVNTWNVGPCCGYAQEHKVDDVTFVSMLIGEIRKSYAVDGRRIYATGLSNGAMMSHRLACQLSDKIAAVAPIAGGLNLGGDFSSCLPSRKVSVLNFHGTTDDNYLYYCDKPEGCRGPDAGSQNELRVSIPSVVHDWVVRNSIPESSKQITYQKGIETCEMYSSPTKDVEVGLCTARPTNPLKVGSIVYDGGGHAMPGGIRNVGSADADVPTQDISANDAMWTFFKAHPMMPASLALSATTISSGDTLTVSWSNVANPTVNDWVAVYKQGDADTDFRTVNKWFYTSSCGTGVGASPNANGSCALTMPTAAGTYELRLFANESYANLATSPTVTVTPSDPSCHTIMSGDPAPTGFGVAWDVFSSARDMLITASCSSSRATITMNAIPNAQYPYRYAYHKGYMTKTGDSSWTAVGYDGTEKISDVWYPGFATLALSLTSQELSQTTYVLGYMCTYVNSTWKCGCRDQACTQSYWQIQRIQR